ncbi:MAG: DegV family protein [Oscillospiraceae bacterium]|jgi:DegV family protein with EDD domain|nr:DegV family protein [Oscillospiraceae bacterium]
MRDYVILTDSCCDFSARMAEELELTVLPLSFTMEGREYFNYPDNRDIAPAEFYSKIRSGALGTTSAINVAAFQTAMEPLVEAGRDILCISFSSNLSTTYQSACIAAQEVQAAHPGCKILVADSRAASLGQGLLVYLAVQEKRKGRSLEELHSYVEEMRDHICHWFTVDDLNHLKRGGRVSAAAALFGTMLQMKPILHVDGEGRLIPVDKVRGRKASISALLEKMDELVEDPSVVFISHGDCGEEAAALGDAIRRKYPVERLEINYVGPVIGNHTGCGVLALFFVGKHK